MSIGAKFCFEGNICFLGMLGSEMIPKGTDKARVIIYTVGLIVDSKVF